MRFEKLSAERIETRGERMASMEGSGVELADEQMESIAGGRFRLPWKSDCQENPNGREHVWEKTGRTKPGDFFGELWRSKEEKCRYCDEYQWVW